jgi:Na+-transporting methylmalonyl-CoA/oxaloacetate decarboxylase beta subunit
MSLGNLSALTQGMMAVTPQSLVMIAVALGLLYLGISRRSTNRCCCCPSVRAAMLANLPAVAAWSGRTAC